MGAFAATLAGCDDASTGARPDTGLADGGADAELRPLLQTERLALHLVSDGAAVALSVDEIPRLRLWAAVVAAGETVALSQLTEVAWTTLNGEAVGRFSGDPALPRITWILSLDGDALRARIEVQSEERIPLNATIPLQGVILGEASPIRLPAEAGPWIPAGDPAPASRLHLQDLRLPDAVFRLVAADGAIETAGHEFAVRFNEAQVLAPGGVASASARLSALPAWRAEPATAAPRAPALGWATGPAHRSAASAELVRLGAEALSAVFAGLPGGRALRLDGLFYAGPGDARVVPPVAENAAALVAAAGEVELWLRWPARHAPARLALLDEVPAARAPDGPACAAPACARLNPEVPAARDRMAREAATLARAGAAALWLPDTADLSGPTRDAWLAVLRDAAPGASFARLDGASAPDLGGALVPEAAAAPAEPCADAATTHPWPAVCAANLIDLVGTTVSAPDDDADLRRLAFALVAAPEGDRALRAPPALRWTGRMRAAQRQAAGLWLVAGGSILLGDNLANFQAFSKEDLHPLRAALALGAGGGEPLEPGEAAPPTRFAGPGYALALNWSDAPLTWQPGPDLGVAAALAAGRSAAEVTGAEPANAHDVFADHAEALPVPHTLTVPAHDAVLLALPR